jgi:hypothetical protein
MQSPFKIFRKHQKLLLAAATLMAMIAFTLGDIVRQMSGGRGGQREAKVIFETNIGNLNEVTIFNLSSQRKILHRFIARAYERSHPELEKPPYAMFAGELVRRTVGAYGFGGLSEFDMLDKWLNLHEARKLGIAVAEHQIQDYIDRITDQKLSEKAFREIVVGELQISPKELYELFRTELEVQTARFLKLPRPLPSPEKYWEYFLQLNTRQKIAVAAVPVDSFTDKTGEPTDAQVAKLFQDHQYDVESAFNAEFRPGFRQPQKVKLQYLEITQADAEERVRAASPVTDQEIEEYYEANKATKVWMQEPPPLPTDETSPDDKTPIDPDITPEEGSQPPTKPGKGPQLQQSDEPGQNDAAPDDPAKPQAKDGELPQTEEKQPECGVVFAKDEAQDESSGKPKTESQPVDSATKDQEPDQKKPATNDAEEPDNDGPVESPKSDAPSKDGDKSKIAAPPEIKFKPLDDEIKRLIRESLIEERTGKYMKEAADGARQAMSNLADTFADSKDIKLVDPDEKQLAELEQRSTAELRKIAAKFGMKFEETGLVSAQALSEIPGIGKAHDPESQMTFRGGVTTIMEQAFLSDGLCQPFESETFATSRYVSWKVRDVAAHVPELTETGIREQVVAAWKRLEAQPLAQKRAEELAKRARSSGEEFQKALADETVTGKSVGQSLAIFTSGEFSFWQELSVANAMPGRRQVQLGNPGGVTNPGHKFMQVVFEQLSDGEIGVALNDDATIYYVVKVLDRRSPDREEFKDARLFGEGSAYASIAQRESDYAMREYQERVRETYAIRVKDLPQRRGRAVSSFDDE